ncbi:MAG: hypothetical protein IJ688_09600 [Treponema sp.]|nr:hypothetical protein [Treponema sp.]
MKNYIKIASPFILIISLLAIFTFRSLPASKLWNEYAVVYVPVETSDQSVLNALGEAKIEGAVTLSGQFLPVNTSIDSLEYSIYRYNSQNDDFSYDRKRNAYFFDKSQNFRLYYIPVQEKQKIASLLSILSASGIKAGADISASYPWILPFISAILLIILTLFSKNKIFFLLAASVPVINLFCNPFYQMAEAECLVMLCLFFISNVWQRRGAIAYLLANHAIPAMLFTALLCAFTCTLKSGFMFTLSLFASASVMVIYKIIQDYIRSKESFVPVYIRPAKKISVYGSNAGLILPLVTAASLVIFAVIFISSFSGISSKSSEKLMLPANSQQSADLPQLEDYYRWTWNFKTYPYKSLNKESSNENFIEYPQFTEEKGVIRQNSLVMAYNQSFKDSVYENIDSLQFNSIEKVLKSEGKDFSGGYSPTNSYTVDLFGIIMSLICVFILLFIYISTMIRKGTKR